MMHAFLYLLGTDIRPGDVIDDLNVRVGRVIRPFSASSRIRCYQATDGTNVVVDGGTSYDVTRPLGTVALLAPRDRVADFDEAADVLGAVSIPDVRVTDEDVSAVVVAPGWHTDPVVVADVFTADALGLPILFMACPDGPLDEAVTVDVEALSAHVGASEVATG